MLGVSRVAGEWRWGGRGARRVILEGITINNGGEVIFHAFKTHKNSGTIPWE